MTSIQQPDLSSVSSGTTTGITTKKQAEDPQDRFLKLLVTQMKNQDPLKPLDNAEVTSQLAQISTVAGIDKLNSTLQQLVSSTDDSRALEALDMIGHSAFVPGKSISLEGEGAIAGIELEQSVDQAIVTIFDSSGIAIHTKTLGVQPAGVSTIGWDGATDSGSKAADGDYTFTVTAKQGDKEVKVNTLSFGTVNSVSHGELGTHLDMGNKLGLVSLSDIKQVF
ncbi:MAG: flagellar hook assembly protein FlgD [Nitrosomonas sp.]|uniref:flagellar hook assembly protein FlgD n=1 Tax=Nitrosomonas sp. TaxID=42353 RepID=UPI0025E5AD98|nr:flagellar hook assembly protein FlgD [Nitrosomonas sp.]MBY0475033.1 flagellar hook assembly protein FlgD [Nitrosomonas sp.]